jgi:hypothetical protein
MHVLNIHEREFDLPLATVGSLIDTLASKSDHIWPNDKWPAMRLDRPLSVGAVGGHGPVRYSVEEYRPGREIHFRFLAPSGFKGKHAFEVEDRQGQTVLRHVLEMRAAGQACLSWPLLFRPLHDALIEDGFDRATVALGIDLPNPTRWPFYVRVLRFAIKTFSKAGRR